MRIIPDPTAYFVKYTYSFNIYKKACPHVYMAIFLEAKDRIHFYNEILIKMLDEKPEDWSTNIDDSCRKKGPYSGKPFFKWLLNQQPFFHFGWLRNLYFSPYELYRVLDKSDEYDVIVETDDPADIRDDVSSEYVRKSIYDMPMFGYMYKGRYLSSPDLMAGLAAKAATSYLDANYSVIADTMKGQGIYGKSIAENLLSDSKAMVRAANDMNDIHAAFKYAFHAGSVIAEAVWQLDSIAAGFRAGEKKFPDIFALVRTIEEAPWPVQKAFLEAEQNADIADFVRQAHTKEFERQIFEDRVAAGDELFKKVGFAEIVDELQNVMQEVAQVHNVFPNCSDFEEEKRLEVIRELNNKLAVLDNKKEKIFLKIKRRIVQYSDISYNDAVKWVNDNVTFGESLVNKMILSKRYNIVKPSFDKINDMTIDIVKDKLAYINKNTNAILNKIKDEIAYIYRITNGNISPVKIEGAKISIHHDRSKACKEENIINLPIAYFGAIYNHADLPKVDFGALYHDAGHVFENANPRFLSPAIRFVKDRATGSPQKLADLTNLSNECDYGDDEMVIPGRFCHPYVGRLHGDATEVLSTGLELLGDAGRFLRGIDDMEHLRFSFGCFASLPLNGIELNDEDGLIKKADNAGKTAAWIEALDNAISDTFATALCTQEGVENFKIIEKVSLAEGKPFLLESERKLITAKVLKYGEDVIAKKNDSDDALKKFTRIVYLAICNLKELIPDACPIINIDYLEKLSCIPPKWFTPLTELPSFDRITEVIMYSYLFNICNLDHEPVVSILMKAENRFKTYKSIFVKASGEQEEWKANKEALWNIQNVEVACFFTWLEGQCGYPPYSFIRRGGFTPYDLYKAVKKSFEYEITVETNESVEDFGDPGTYFKDRYIPGAIY